MDILKEVKEILAEQDWYEKDNKLEELIYALDFHPGLNKVEIIEGVRLLLPAALQEDNGEMQQMFWRAIESAVVYSGTGDCIDWDAVASALPSIEEWNLEYVLNVLGQSGQARYLPILNEYAQHADPIVRECALNAICDIEGRIAYGTPVQKAR